MTEQTPPPARNMPITVHAQYIRDLSFENPNAPGILKASAGQPRMDMSINIGLRDVQDADIAGLYEVSLRLRAEAKRGDVTAFIAEVDYAASVTAGEEVPKDALHPLLMIEIPRLIFPFARQVIADLSQQGGYPSVMIAPVDFQALYIQKFSAEMEAGQKQTG